MDNYILRDFAFETRDIKLILYLQNCLLVEDLQNESNERLRARKQVWIDKWKQSITSNLNNSISKNENWFESTIDYSDRLKELSLTENRLKAGIILLEVLLLEPYSTFQKPENRVKVNIKLFEKQLRANQGQWVKNLQQDAISLGYQANDVDRLVKSVKKTTQQLTKRWQKLGIYTISGLTLGMLGFGAVTAPIALGIGAATGLSGAASFTFGMASLGGIIGGGMFQGSVVMLAGGAIFGGTGGMITGGTVGYIAQKQLNVEVIKFEVILKEIILQQRDFATYHKVLEQQRATIQSYERELDRLKFHSEQHEEQIKKLESAIKLLKTSLQRMQKGVDGLE